MMIKLFRKIRQNLLMENLSTEQAGKTGKYLKYAIGEIVLVVIGILIALQINNWNNSRLESQLERDYFERLVEDLKEEEAIINAVLDYNEQILIHAKKAIKVYENAPDRNTNPLEILIDMYQASQLQDPNSAMSTYKELISSGQINLIKNKAFKTALIRYFETNWTETAVLQLPNHYRDNLRRKMPDDVQSEIRANCDDIYVRIRKSIEVQLPKNCSIHLDKDYAVQVVNELQNDASLKNDLRFLIGNVEAKIKHISSSKAEIQSLFDQLEEIN